MTPFPYTIYATDVDDATMDQMDECMSRHFVIRGALMADAHLGYEMPIGGVIVTDGWVVPAWVGYDIGCGVSVSEMFVPAEEAEKRAEDILDEIKKTVPMGFSQGKYDEYYQSTFADQLSDAAREAFIARGGSAALGTLGGGNHFIEIGYRGHFPGCVSIVVHSGSRGPGHGIASHYMDLCEHGGLSIRKDAGREYLSDCEVMMRFATVNRNIISKKVAEAIASVVGWDGPCATREVKVDTNHNHIKQIAGRIFVHRKGACSAEAGEIVAIPGNMRDGTYLCKGKGNPDGLASCSHGAGRALSRKQAKKNISMQEYERSMEGIVANVTEDNLDEAPAAYKDFDTVMDNQKDLVEIIDHITPIINVKG